MAIAILLALLHRAAHRRGPVGRPVVHRGGPHAARARAARLDRERPAAAAPGLAELQPQRVSGDGAARHLPAPRATTSGSRSPAATTPTGARSRAWSARPWAREPRFATLAGRLAAQDELDARARGVDARPREGARPSRRSRRAGVPAAPVAKPAERIDGDPATAGLGLWPTVQHSEMGDVRVDGLPVHLSETDWAIARGGPCLGEHNEPVLGGLLGLVGRRRREAARGGRRMSAALAGHPRASSSSHERGALRGQAARRHGRRRDRGRAARRQRAAPLAARSSSDVPGPGAEPRLVALQHQQARRRARPRRRDGTRRLPAPRRARRLVLEGEDPGAARRARPRPCRSSRAPS